PLLDGRVVVDVLASALVPAAAQHDDRPAQREAARDLALERLELVLVDRERECANRVVAAHFSLPAPAEPAPPLLEPPSSLRLICRSAARGGAAARRAARPIRGRRRSTGTESRGPVARTRRARHRRAWRGASRRPAARSEAARSARSR